MRKLHITIENHASKLQEHPLPLLQFDQWSRRGYPTIINNDNIDVGGNVSEGGNDGVEIGELVECMRGGGDDDDNTQPTEEALAYAKCRKDGHTHIGAMEWIEKEMGSKHRNLLEDQQRVTATSQLASRRMVGASAVPKKQRLWRVLIMPQQHQCGVMINPWMKLLICCKIPLS